MLDWLHHSEAAASERKLRLFAVACCLGCFSHRLLDPRSAAAVDVAARLVEGRADAAEVARAASAAHEVDEARRGIAYDGYDALTAEVATLTLTDPLTAAMLSPAMARDREEDLW